MDKKYNVKPIKKHVLENVWNSYPEALSNNVKSIPPPSTLQNIIGDVFALGEYYYYVINVFDSTVINFHPDILKIHGLKKYPKHLSEIINLIHPDDIQFVVDAESKTLEKIKEIGFEHQLNLKCSYCFRMKTENGNYEMFHHQSIHTLKDEEGKLLQAINIHTNIHHITQKNPYTVIVAGIGERKDFHQMQLYNHIIIENPTSRLTKREIETLSLIGKGCSVTEIGLTLNISQHTAHTHRKNIMSKMNVSNTSQLIRKSIESGYL